MDSISVWLPETYISVGRHHFQIVHSTLKTKYEIKPAVRICGQISNLQDN